MPTDKFKVGGGKEHTAGRERAVQSILRSEERLRVILESAAGYAIFTMDANAVIDWWSPGAADVFGWSEAEIVGQLLHRLFTPEDREAGAPETELETARREGAAPDQRWHMRKDGSRVFIDGFSYYIEDPPSGFLKIGRDMTTHRSAEQVSSQIAAIVESSDDAIISKDLQSMIQTWNRGAETLFGYTAEEAIGKSILMLIPERLAIEEEQILASIRRGEPIHHYETIRRRKDGSEVEISLTVSPIRDPLGTIVGASKIARDITRRREQERALADAHAALVQHAEDLTRFNAAAVGREERIIELKRKINELSKRLGEAPPYTMVDS